MKKIILSLEVSKMMMDYIKLDQYSLISYESLNDFEF